MTDSAATRPSSQDKPWIEYYNLHEKPYYPKSEEKYQNSWTVTKVCVAAGRFFKDVLKAVMNGIISIPNAVVWAGRKICCCSVQHRDPSNSVSSSNTSTTKVVSPFSQCAQSIHYADMSTASTGKSQPPRVASPTPSDEQETVSVDPHFQPASSSEQPNFASVQTATHNLFKGLVVHPATPVALSTAPSNELLTTPRFDVKIVQQQDGHRQSSSALSVQVEDDHDQSDTLSISNADDASVFGTNFDDNASQISDLVFQNTEVQAHEQQTPTASKTTEHVEREETGSLNVNEEKLPEQVTVTEQASSSTVSEKANSQPATSTPKSIFSMNTGVFANSNGQLTNLPFTFTSLTTSVQTPVSSTAAEHVVPSEPQEAGQTSSAYIKHSPTIVQLSKEEQVSVKQLTTSHVGSAEEPEFFSDSDLTGPALPFRLYGAGTYTEDNSVTAAVSTKQATQENRALSSAAPKSPLSVETSHPERTPSPNPTIEDAEESPISRGNTKPSSPAPSLWRSGKPKRRNSAVLLLPSPTSVQSPGATSVRGNSTPLSFESNSVLDPRQQLEAETLAAISNLATFAHNNSAFLDKYVAASSNPPVAAENPGRIEENEEFERLLNRQVSIAQKPNSEVEAPHVSDPDADETLYDIVITRKKQA